MHGIVAHMFFNTYEKIHQFLSSKRDTKENWFLFSASRCTYGKFPQNSVHQKLLKLAIFDLSCQKKLKVYMQSIYAYYNDKLDRPL